VGGIVVTVFNLFPFEDLMGVSAEPDVREADLNGDCLADETLGGFSTILPLEL
jgi:hypothetical protein